MESEDVYLVTNDKAFFNGRDLKNGLADSLKFEANRKKHKVYIFPELSKLLETIKIDTEDLDTEDVTVEFKKNIASLQKR